jgi:ribosomal protein S18 acetylase RimI-like enzyme
VSGPADPGGVQFRQLRADDADRLAQLFAGMSDATRATFAPHPLDDAGAAAIAAAAGRDGTRRILGVDGAGSVVAYGLVVLGIGEHEARRCAEAGIRVDPATAAMVAPVVADAWQGRGVGSALLGELLAAAAAAHRPTVVLLGGVQVVNVAAVRLYEHAGFRAVNRWDHPPGTANTDMILELRA